MIQGKRLATLLVIATVVLSMAIVAPAAAHESQEIDGYELTFGGAEEPVITDERTWLQLRITDEDGEPVPDQADTLEWRVEKPGEVDPVHLDVSEKHGAPGVYEAAVVFTEPGEYTVHIEGTVDGTEVHTHFEKEVHDNTDLQYPEDSRLDSLESEVEHNHEAIHDLQEQVEELESSSGLVGTGLFAVIGLIAIGGLAVIFARKRR